LVVKKYIEENKKLYVREEKSRKREQTLPKTRDKKVLVKEKKRKG